MKSFDAFGRPVQEFQVKTTFGGYLSLCSLGSVVILFFSELHYFLQLETKDHMVIDQFQDQKYVNISLGVTLPTTPCALLGLNLLDPKKANIMHVWHEIYKTRITPGGRVIGRRVRDSLTNVALDAAQAVGAVDTEAGAKAAKATTHLRCQSCYQSHDDEDDCCATCDEVRADFRKRGLDDRPKGYIFGQCAEEAYAEAPPEEQEGCRLEASLRVKKVPATLYVGVPQHFSGDLLKSDPVETVSSLDFEHTIDKLAFGPDFPGLVHVLDGRKKTPSFSPDSEHFEYSVHVIPTRYIEDGADPIASHQYSVLEYSKAVKLRQSAEGGMSPGLAMTYDFTPFEVRVTRNRKSMWHFLTECCAILGGVFAFSGMVDNLAYQLNGSAKRGGEIQMVDQ